MSAKVDLLVALFWANRGQQNPVDLRLVLRALEMEPTEETLASAKQLLDSSISSLESELNQDICRSYLVQWGQTLTKRRRIADRYRLAASSLNAKDGHEHKAFQLLAESVIAWEFSPSVEAGTEATIEKPGVATGPELYFGLVRLLGTSSAPLIEELRSHLEKVGYLLVLVEVGSQLGRIPSLSHYLEVDKNADLIGYYDARMDAGDTLRRVDRRALAFLSVDALRSLRPSPENILGSEHRGVAYVFDSLMHKDEVSLLRELYGSRFFVISLYEDIDRRRSNLMAKPAYSAHARKVKSAVASVELDDLLTRDRGRQGPERKSSDLSTEDVFHLGDVFYDIANPPSSTGGDGVSGLTLKSLVEQIFSAPFNTPTRHELAMSYAYVTALRTATLTRRVGAAIASREGDLLAVGTNEVPRPGGGQYWNSQYDFRDHRYRIPEDPVPIPTPTNGYDSNDQIKRQLLSELLSGLARADLISNPAAPDALPGLGARYEADVDSLCDLVLNDKILARTRFFDVIEYGRSVHAEMAALMTCARRGISVLGAELYVTTFPCHECARHIIASGITRVIYIEPYAKSRVFELHADAVTSRKRPIDDLERIEFLPFIGIAPSRLAELFSWVPRKVSDLPGGIRGDGGAVEFDLTLHGPLAEIRPSIIRSGFRREVQEQIARQSEEIACAYFQRLLQEKGVEIDEFQPT